MLQPNYLIGNGYTVRLFLFILMELTCSCKREPPIKNGIFTFGTLEGQLAEMEADHKPLLIVMAETGCSPCEAFINGISQDALLATRIKKDFVTLYYPVNAAGNELLPRVLGEYQFPTILYFDTSLSLKAVIRGCIANTLLSTLLDSSSKSGVFINYRGEDRWPRNSQKEKSLEEVIRGWRELNRHAYDKAFEHIQKSVAYHPAFFNQYLSAFLAFRAGDQHLADSLARKAMALVYRNSLTEFLYVPLLPSLQFFSPGVVPPDRMPKGNMAFEQVFYPCGKVKKGASLIMTINYKNTGEVPDSLKRVTASCDCMEIRYENRLLQPGEINTITVVYDTSVKGMFSKLLFAELNREDKTIVITISGEIVAAK